MAELHLLRTFLAVYRSGTFTRAAHELHLTQPAVSVHIRALETQIGKPLFRRKARGVLPTSAGRELAQAISAHVDALESILDGKHAKITAVGDTVHIGGPEEFLGVRVFPELAPMMENGLQVRFYFGVDTPVLQRLVDGELDLAILTLDTRQQGIETQPLCFEHLDLVGSSAWHEMLGDITEGPEGADQLANVPLAAHDEDLPLIRIYWQSVFQKTPPMRAMLVANSLRSSLQFAIYGIGITVLPSHTTADPIDRGDLVRLLNPTTPIRSRLYLAWRAGSLRRSSLAQVHECIAHAAQSW